MVAAVTGRWAEDQRARRERPDRQRAGGGGRRCERALALRVAVVLTYLRLHVPQEVVGAAVRDQPGRGVARTARGAARAAALPALPGGAGSRSATRRPSRPRRVLTLEQAGGGRVLIDATEQRVSRPGDDATQRRYYSGKKKQHTLKTQLVTDDDHHILRHQRGRAGGDPRQDALRRRCTPWTACPTGWRPTPTRAIRGSPRRSRRVARLRRGDPRGAAAARAWPPGPRTRSRAAAS